MGHVFESVSESPGGSWREFHHAAMPLEELPGWHAVLRFEEIDGVAKLRELRVVAGDIDAQVTKRESVTDLGLTLADPDPDRELTATMLRRVAVDRLARIARLGVDSELVTNPRIEPFLIDPRRPGRRGRDDLEYARLALEYATEIESGNRHPTKTLAAAHHVGVNRMSQLINEARNRGLLTRPRSKGRPGGELTDAAVELIEAEGGQSEKKGGLDVG